MTGLSQSLVSYHLLALRHAGLVTAAASDEATAMGKATEVLKELSAPPPRSDERFGGYRRQREGDRDERHAEEQVQALAQDVHGLKRTGRPVVIARRAEAHAL